MDLFEKQAQLQSLFQTSPVDAAYAQGTSTGRRIAGKYQDLDVALLLLQRVNASEFFDYQVYFVSELSKTLEIEGLDVVILNQASLLQRAQIIRSWSLLYQRDQKRRVHFEARSVMDYLEFKKYDDVQSKVLAERTRGERFAIDAAYVRARLARLREYTTLLADLRQIEHTKFKADPKLYGLAQWHLQQAVELLFGTGAYLVTAPPALGTTKTAQPNQIPQEAGLTAYEAARVRDLVTREPNELEWAMFGAMWSEHCAYKHSKKLLRRLPSRGPSVAVGPGENA